MTSGYLFTDSEVVFLSVQTVAFRYGSRRTRDTDAVFELCRQGDIRQRVKRFDSIQQLEHGTLCQTDIDITARTDEPVITRRLDAFGGGEGITTAVFPGQTGFKRQAPGVRYERGIGITGVRSGCSRGRSHVHAVNHPHTRTVGHIQFHT